MPQGVPCAPPAVWHVRDRWLRGMGARLGKMVWVCGGAGVAVPPRGGIMVWFVRLRGGALEACRGDRPLTPWRAPSQERGAAGGVGPMRGAAWPRNWAQARTSLARAGRPRREQPWERPAALASSLSGPAGLRAPPAGGARTHLLAGWVVAVGTGPVQLTPLSSRHCGGGSVDRSPCARTALARGRTPPRYAACARETTKTNRACE